MAQVAAAHHGRSTLCVPIAITIRGPVDVRRLRAAVAALVARHDALRARLVRDGGDLGMVVADQVPYVEVPLSEYGMVEEELRRPIDLRGALLWRAALHRMEPDRHVLTIVADHGVMDGMSARIVTEDLAALYRGESLDAVPETYGEFATAEARPIAPEARQFWTAERAGSTTRLYRPPIAQVANIQATLHDVGRVARRRVLAVARAHRVTTSAVLVGMTLRAVRRMARPKLTVGVIVGGREVRWQRTVGCVADVMPVSVDLSSGPAWAVVADRIDEAMQHRVPIRAIQDLYAPAPGEPLFDVTVNYLPGGSEGAAGEFTCEIRQYDNPLRKLQGWYPASALLDVQWRDEGEDVRGYVWANGPHPLGDLPKRVVSRLRDEMSEVAKWT
jgi:hypothetical protein